jgi:hypothetical protein
MNASRPAESDQDYVELGRQIEERICKEMEKARK